MVYTDPDEVPWSAYLATGAVFLVVVAALLPWFGDGSQATTGLAHDDGNLTAGVAVAALGLLVAYEWGPISQVGAALAGVVTLWIGYGTWDQVAGDSTLDPRLGLYLTLLGGAALLAVAIYGSVGRRWLAEDGGGSTRRSIE